MEGGGFSTIGGGGDSTVAGGAGSSVVGGGSSTAGRGSSTGGVEGSSTAGGSPAAGGGGGAGSLVVGAGSSSAGGTVSPILPGKLLVLIGGEALRDEGSRVACGANDSFVAVGEEEGSSCAAGGAVLGVTRTAAGTGAGPALADRSVAIWRSLSPVHGILVAAATSSLTLRSTLSPSVPSTAVTCSSICSSTPPATRLITSSGESMGLSESGASQLSSETNTTAAATTPVPASTYPRLARPRRRTKRLACANRRRAGAFEPRPPPPSLRPGCFSICLSIRGAPLPLTAVVSGRVLVDLLVARGGVARAHVNGRAYVLEFEIVCLGAALNDAYLVLGVSGVGHPLDACALVGVVARV